MQKIIALLILALLSSASVVSAQINWDISGFSGIDVSGNIDVLLEKGTEDKVVISSPNQASIDIDIYVDGDGILRLYALKSLILDKCSIKIKVTYTELKSIKAIAGAEVYSKETIRTDNLWVKAGSGGQIELTIDADHLEARATEGGELELKGTVNSQYAFAATGGEYDGLDLSCSQTQARANTGGEIMVNASETLSARANTGGVIEYFGEAKVQSLQTGISGKVRRLKNRGMRLEWN